MVEVEAFSSGELIIKLKKNWTSNLIYFPLKSGDKQPSKKMCILHSQTNSTVKIQHQGNKGQLQHSKHGWLHILADASSLQVWFRWSKMLGLGISYCI